MSTVDAARRRDARGVIDALWESADSEFKRSAVSREEGNLLRCLAAKAQVRRTIEVGFGNGVSSLYICSALQGKEGVQHTAIDPFQTSDFHGRGVANLRGAGIDFFRLIELPSEVALPQLLHDGERYDLALIDGLHTADQTMVDFYYLDRLLRAGGFLVFDDVNARAVNKVARYASTYPNYRLVDVSGRRGSPRRFVNTLKQGLSLALWPLRKLVGEAALREFLDVSVVRPGMLWSLDFHTMAAFQKTGEYARDTNWYDGL